MSESPLNLPTCAASFNPWVRGSRWLALGCLGGLIVLGLAWELWLARTGNGTLAVKVLPLLVPVVGLARHRLYTYRWVSLMVWLYCAEGLVRATSSQGLTVWLAGLEVALCIGLFAACAIQVRVRLRLAKQPAPSSATPSAPLAS